MSRRDSRSRRLRQRPSRTVPASIVALLALAIGVLTCVVAVSRLITGTWPSQAAAPAASIATATWGSSSVITAGAVVIVIGAILLVAGLKPGGFTTAPLRGGASSRVDGTDFVITSRGIARLAAAQADHVDGVEKVSTSASWRRVRLTVTTTSNHGDQIAERVTRNVSDALTAAGLDPAPRVTATIVTKEI
jgi:hypothetical protein